VACNTGVRNNLTTSVFHLCLLTEGEARVQTTMQSMQDTCKTKWQWGLFMLGIIPPIFWDKTMCIMVYSSWRFGRTFWLHFQGSIRRTFLYFSHISLNTEAANSTTVYTKWYPRRLHDFSGPFMRAANLVFFPPYDHSVSVHFSPPVR